MPVCFASGRDEDELVYALAEAPKMWSGRPAAREAMELDRRLGPGKPGPSVAASAASIGPRS